MSNSCNLKKNELPQEQPPSNRTQNFLKLVFPACLAISTFPSLAFGSVESSLQAVQSKLVGTLLPLAAICGLVIAGFSFTMGHANVRFGVSQAEQIVDAAISRLKRTIVEIESKAKNTVGPSCA